MSRTGNVSGEAGPRGPACLALAAAAFVTAAFGAGGGAVAGQTEPRGKVAYLENCAACHGPTLDGGFGGALSGKAFADKWKVQGRAALHTKIATTMPPGATGQLPAAVYDDIVAFIAAANDIGDAKPARTVNAQGRVVHAAAPNMDPIAASTIGARTARLKGMRAVDQAMLAAPSPGDWLHWRRTYDAHGFSPLKQIDRTNAARLVPAWSLALAPGANQITPLVHDGTMFVASGNQVVAIDAATGDIAWKFVRQTSLPPGTRNQPRSIAIAGDRLFVPTLDAHMLAIDARTGILVWDRQFEPAASGVQVVAGPLVVDGKVIQGAAGCASEAKPGGCFLVALDVKDGRELWRVDTIARDDSWNGAPVDKRFGGAIWSTASYDPGTGLIYVGTGQTYKTATLRQPGGPPSPANAALHTDSTLAIDPATGRIAWSYQHLQRDIWDYDWAFEQVVADLGGRRVVLSMGKLGIVDALDARTGAFVQARDAGLQKVVTAIDPVTGRKTTDPAIEPAADGEGMNICPSSFGVRNWPATAYDAARGILFVPMFEACMDFFWNPGLAWDISWKVKPAPGSDGKFGRVTAIDLATGKTLWSQRQRAPQSSAILATAGGLVFEGGRDRWFRVRDAETGDALWQTRLSGPPSAFPISFEADGVQYIAVTAGGGGPLDSGLQTFTPEIDNPSGAPTLFVFKLAD